MTTIRYWFNEFNRDRTSIFDEDRSGYPNEVTTEDMVDIIHDIVLADRWVKIGEIADTVNISIERLQNILHEKLGMRKLSARWVPRLLTLDEKRNRVTTSMQSLAKFKHNPSDFLRHYVTVDET